MEPIDTKRLLIRELNYDDARRMSEYRDKHEVAFFQSWWHYPYAKAKKRVEYCLQHPFNGQRGNYQLGVVLKENNVLIGDYYLEVNGPNSVTIGYTFDNDYWHCGYARESFKALLRVLKQIYDFKIVFAYVYDDNFPSIKLLEYMGFERFEKSIFMGDLGYRLYLQDID